MSSNIYFFPCHSCLHVFLCFHHCSSSDFQAKTPSTAKARGWAKRAHSITDLEREQCCHVDADFKEILGLRNDYGMIAGILMFDDFVAQTQGHPASSNLRLTDQSGFAHISTVTSRKSQVSSK